MVEIWKWIRAHDEYQVSDLGRVRSWNQRFKKRPVPFILTPWISGGRCHISLGRDVRFLVHVLVAKSFVYPYRGEVVHHIDDNPQNNCATNLEWTTKRRNTSLAISRRNRDLPTGVLRLKSGKFSSIIRFGGVSRYLGSYDTPELAGQVYKKAVSKIEANLFIPPVRNKWPKGISQRSSGRFRVRVKGKYVGTFGTIDESIAACERAKVEVS